MFIDQKIILEISFLTLIVIAFICNSCNFKIKIKIKYGAVIFSFISLILLYNYSIVNLSDSGSDYNLYCRMIDNPLFEKRPFWINREFLFWRVLNFYNLTFFNYQCSTTFTFYMAPFFYSFFYYCCKISKVFLKNKDDSINFVVIPITVTLIPYLYLFQNHLRSGVSYSFLIAGFYFLIISKYTKATITFIAGFFIHNSIIIFIPVLLIYKFKNKLKFYSYFLTMVLYFFYAYFIKFAISFLNKGIGSETYAICVIYISLLILWLSLPYLIKYSTNSSSLIIKIENIINFTKILSISLIPFILSSFNPSLLLRLTLYYYVLFTPLLLGIIDLEFKNKFQLNLIIFLALIPSLYNIIG